jgi:putative membrane protein
MYSSLTQRTDRFRFFSARNLCTWFRLVVRGGILAALVLAAGSVSAADLSRHEKLFLRHAAEGGNAELEATKLVATKAANPAVIKFAQATAADQQGIVAELRRLALAKGVKLPDQPSKMQQASIIKLAKLDGVRFDKEYSREIGVLAHKDIVALFQQAQKSAKDADVKAFASKTLPLLEQQLKMGQQLMMAVEKNKVQS